MIMWGGALRDDTKNGCVADYNNEEEVSELFSFAFYF